MSNSTNSSPSSSRRSANRDLAPSLAIHGRSLSQEAVTVSSQHANSTSDGDDRSISSRGPRKRDKFISLFRSAKPEDRAAAGTSGTKIHKAPAAATEAESDGYADSCINVVSVAANRKESPTDLTRTCSNIFPNNITRPSSRVELPKPGARIDTTPQLALCGSLLNSALSLHSESRLEKNSDQPSQDVLTDGTDRDWVKHLNEHPIEQYHIRWLLMRMVEEFAKDAVKGSSSITEVVLLGPVLDNEQYRCLLSCFLNKFDQSVILDVDLLHGLVLLVQYASEGYLLEDDLVKIMSIIRKHLQDTHMQSSDHPYHLTLALSRVLDVMAQHEVKDVDRVEQHEPLAEVLRSLQESSDPFLMYQASYAFQALQCIPDDETILQAMMRRSGVVAEGLVNISGVVNLDLGGFLEGLGQVHKTIVETMGIAKSAYEGARSLIEGGQDVLAAIKQGISSGSKRAWYPAIIGASTLVREGRLADFKVVVLEAACRNSHEFQWGICQMLGEIALDPMWESTTRQQAVDFLVELYSNDPYWGRDTSVKSWMLTILHVVSERADQGPEVSPAFKKRYFDNIDTAMFNKPYPLLSRCAPPPMWLLLCQVQKMPYVEHDLHLLRTERLQEYSQNVYIPPLAKASIQASDKDAVPLMNKVEAFLDSDQHVFLVLGDSGAGKSTFNKHLEHKLWSGYKQEGPIPLFINLPAIDRPDQDLIGKQLRIHNFSEPQIQELKLHRQIILICDSYDETQLKVNLHRANLFNQKGQPNIKMVISCRSTYIGSDYRNLFQPQQSDRYNTIATDLYAEAVIVPFSSDQVEDYVGQFVRDPEVHKLRGDRAAWSTEDYMGKLRSIPKMMELVRNPFLLSLSLRALPVVVKDAEDLSKVKVTRLTLYDSFIHQWLEINKLRLENINLPADTASALQELLEEGFTMSGIRFSEDLAAAIFREQDGNPVVQYTPRLDKETWKVDFFGPKHHVTLLRESSPLSRAGTQHRFFHRSLLEYFYSRHVHEFMDKNLVSGVSCGLTGHPLSQRNLVEEPSIVQFLAEHVQRDSTFKQGLYQIIDQSKSDANVSRAAANAITILVRADIPFNGADLNNIRIPGADLSGGQFDSAQLQGADLRNTNLRNIWLRQADLSKAQMADAQFGEWPFLEEEHGVTSCVYSSDGETFAVGLTSGTINLYRTMTWEKTHTLDGHTDYVFSVVFSPNGLQIASGSSDKTVRLWDAQTGASGAILSSHTDYVRSVVFSPSGQQIASGSDDNTVRLWDAQTGAPGAILSGHTDYVLSVVFSPNGQQIASGSDDRTVRLWDARTGAPGAILSGHTGYVLSVVFSPNGQQIASGSDDTTVRLWDAQTGAPGAILSGHTNRVLSVVFSPSGLQIASGSDDRTVRLWDAQTGAPGAILSGHTSAVMSVMFSPSGQQIASSSSDKTVRLWKAQTAIPGAITSGHTSAVMSVVFSPSGQQIASGSSDGTIRLWDAKTGAPGAILGGHTNLVSSVVFSPSGQQIASSSWDNTVRLWDAQTGTPGMILSGHADWTRSVVFSPSGQQIASGSDDGTIRLWDVKTGAPGAILGGHAHWVRSVVFSPSGQQIASGSDDKTVRLWDAQTGAPGDILKSHTNSVWSVVFSPSGMQIASGSEDKTVRLWDTQTGASGAILDGHAAEVISVVFSPSGQQIATGSNDRTVRLWDVKSGYCLATIKDFLGAINSIAWNAGTDGSYLATGSGDKSVRLWKVAVACDSVDLLWSTWHDQLVVSDALISDAQGLSGINRKLLEQRGAVSQPTSLKEP